jgi:hypothetical protein
MNEGFYIPDAWLALVFFRWCCRYHIEPHDPRRLEAWRRMVKKKKAVYLRDVRPALAGKKVVAVGFEKPHECSSENYCRDHVRCLCMCQAEHKKETQ